MRVLHIVGGLNRGGAETWLVQCLRHIDRAKYQFDFLVHTEQSGAYDNAVRSLGARIIPCLAPRNPVRYAVNFLQILREHGPYDCVHSHVHHFSGFALALARLGRVPVRIAHAHVDSRVWEHQRGIGRKMYLGAATLLIDRCATAGLAVSSEAAISLFGENWKADPRWRLSRLGIELEPFCCPVDCEETRSELRISPHAFVVGHVGRFFEQKNHEFLLKIAKVVCALRPEAVFLLVGDGPLRRKMEDRAKELGIHSRIRFAGVRGDIPRLMKGAMDVLLFPSLYEGFPVVLMEAQAAGLPCIISDVITEEIDLVPHLIHRLSLQADAARWAEFVAQSVPLDAKMPHIEAMQPHSIDGAVGRLCEIYAHG